MSVQGNCPNTPYPPAAPPAEIFVSTSGSGPHQSGPDRILMILRRRPSFSGIGGAHHRRACPGDGPPAEAAAWSGGRCSAGGTLFSDFGSSWLEVTAFGPAGVSAAERALTGAFPLSPLHAHPDAFPGEWAAHPAHSNTIAPRKAFRTLAYLKKVLIEALIFFPSKINPYFGSPI